MKTLNDIFTAAMGLMDELDASGAPGARDTAEYRVRAPGIVNMMISEYRILAGLPGSFAAVEAMDDPILKIDDAYAVGVMHYGLAANLLVDENPGPASFFQRRYEELRNLYFTRRPASDGERVEDLYGGIEYGKFARW